MGNMALSFRFFQTIYPYCVLQFLPFINIGMNRLCISIDFVCNKTFSKNIYIYFFYLRAI